MRSANQFHHEVRLTVAGDTDVEHLGDAGMIHHRDGLAFGFETRNHFGVADAGLDNFHRHAAADGMVLVGNEHKPEAAFADFFSNPVRTDRGADHVGPVIGSIAPVASIAPVPWGRRF